MDESGASKDFQELKGYQIENNCKFFTLGGIIVNNESRTKFKKGYDLIISTYFNFDLPPDFKLHYEELRNAHLRKEETIYKKFDKPTRRKIADRVFETIKEIDCWLLSVTIDLKKHYCKYTDPVTPLSYGLYLILERFQYFLEDQNDKGQVIYEQYNDKVKHRVNQTHRKLDENKQFPKYTNFANLIEVYSGQPYSEYMLAFADFFAFLPWVKCNSQCTLTDRYNYIKYKYYNLDHPIYTKRGNYEI